MIYNLYHIHIYICIYTKICAQGLGLTKVWRDLFRSDGLKTGEADVVLWPSASRSAEPDAVRPPNGPKTAESDAALSSNVAMTCDF